MASKSSLQKTKVAITPYKGVSTQEYLRDNAFSKDIQNMFLDPSLGWIRRDGALIEKTFTTKVVRVVKNMQDANGEYFDLLFFLDGTIKALYLDDNTVVPITEVSANGYFNTLEILSFAKLGTNSLVSNSNIMVESTPAPTFSPTDCAVLNFLQGGVSKKFTITCASLSGLTTTRTYYDYGGFTGTLAGVYVTPIAKTVTETLKNITVTTTNDPGTYPDLATAVYIAETLANRFNTLPYDGVGGHEAFGSYLGLRADVYGSIIVFRVIAEKGKANLSSLRIEGDSNYFKYVYDRVQDESYLPPFAVNDMLVLVGNNSDTGYYVRFLGNLDNKRLSEGTWVECPYPGSADGQWNLNTMPQVLFVRKDLPNGFIGVGETVYTSAISAGIPEDELVKTQYQPRESGDDNSNPVPPISGDYIIQLNSTQNRVFFVSNGSVCVSKINEGTALYRSTNKELLDDEPFYVSRDDVRGVVDYDRNIIIICGRKQYALNAKAGLTSRNALAFPVGELNIEGYNFYSDGETIFTTAQQGSDIKHFELFTNPTGEGIVQTENSAHVSGWLNGNVVNVHSDKKMSMHFMLTGNELYIYKYLGLKSDRKLGAYSVFKFANGFSGQSLIDVNTVKNKLIIYATSNDSTKKTVVFSINMDVSSYKNTKLKYLDFWKYVNTGYNASTDTDGLPGRIVSFFDKIPWIENGVVIDAGTNEAISGYEYDSIVEVGDISINDQNQTPMVYDGVVNTLSIDTTFNVQIKIDNEKLSSFKQGGDIVGTISELNSLETVYVSKDKNDSIKISTNNQKFMLHSLSSNIIIKKIY